MYDDPRDIKYTNLHKDRKANDKLQLPSYQPSRVKINKFTISTNIFGTQVLALRLACYCVFSPVITAPEGRSRRSLGEAEMTTDTNNIDSPSSSNSLSQEDAEAMARDWIAAWNRRDLDAILKHYDGSVQFLSPRVIASYKQHRVRSPHHRSWSAMPVGTMWVWQQ